MTSNDLAHCAATLSAAPAEVAFAYLAEASNLGSWALGCWGATAVSEGLVRGRSLYDGRETVVRAVPDPERLAVDFEVGDEASPLVRRIMARVVPGSELGSDPGHSLVILLAWRPAGMDDERWHRLVSSHEVEILLLRCRIEAEAAKR
ncbi:MAG TPA: hypothetical protein VNK94_04380 [Gaiellaceae bacterium]|nr:hypothetical protein [Gaiellaceae bacterium]